MVSRLNSKVIQSGGDLGDLHVFDHFYQTDIHGGCGDQLTPDEISNGVKEGENCGRDCDERADTSRKFGEL